jgi:hypothetical protein
MIEHAGDHNRGVRSRGSSAMRLWAFVLLAITLGVIATVVHARGGKAIALGSGDGVLGPVTSQPPTRFFPSPK